ncbi:nuclear transport factor 2 family protein [Xanthomarina sp. F2636L]|uniref:nuclear transport factor 2 family protein n=1 Tax=Xanthomarina sp. F2636L TaxID=2996018 RepID=UPI00225DE585|nr:nuclear transport factor 2 family protein [Xanthomarina sp. F2636L]MCX7550508.1 nuclear transport factor 2 family protein [Xanthomarina sp. F2636L]
MKNFILIGCLLFMFPSCKKQHRYTQDSDEIEIVKAAISDYNYQEWENLMSHYNDTAHIYYNSRSNILSPKDLESFHINHDVGFSTRAFEDENREYEMIEDNNGKSWVNFWGLLKGNLEGNNKQITIPVHITYQFIDKKIVTEFGYWDSSRVLLELEKMKAEKTVSDNVKTKSEVEDIIEVVEIEEIDDLE